MTEILTMSYLYDKLSRLGLNEDYVRNNALPTTQNNLNRVKGKGKRLFIHPLPFTPFPPHNILYIRVTTKIKILHP